MLKRIVMLPDGDVGTVTGLGERLTVDVTHEDRAFGRGPWVFAADQLEFADDSTADAYTKRCDRFAQSGSSLPGAAYAAA